MYQLFDNKFAIYKLSKLGKTLCNQTKCYHFNILLETSEIEVSSSRTYVILKCRF